MTIWARRSTILIALTAGGCAFEAPTVPVRPPTVLDTTRPVQLRLDASSRPEQLLSVVATVLSEAGTGIADVPLTFTIGAGTITPTAVVTDGAGQARATAATPVGTTITVAGGNLTTSMDVLATQTHQLALVRPVAADTPRPSYGPRR